MCVVGVWCVCVALALPLWAAEFLITLLRLNRYILIFICMKVSMLLLAMSMLLLLLSLLLTLAAACVVHA